MIETQNYIFYTNINKNFGHSGAAAVGTFATGIGAVVAAPGAVSSTIGSLDPQASNTLVNITLITIGLGGDPIVDKISDR
ncbi:MAG: hypothetical protein FWG78_01315 [Coriobacteriia bacterium]|nr:hypothetical protein [Coriobacteriia bacterium]